MTARKMCPPQAVVRGFDGFDRLFPIFTGIPSHSAQNPADMIGMVFYSEPPSNDGSYPLAGPLIGAQVGRSGALLQNAEEMLAFFC